MDILFYIFVAVLGYLCGSVSFSIILSKKHFKKDVRTLGSGNAGATNVARVFGFKAGIATLLCDIVKMLVPMAVGSYFGGETGLCIAGIAGIVGHCFPLYFGFRGGKGVSVALVITGFVDIRVTLICLAVFIIFVLITKIVSISSILAALALSVSAICFSVSTERIILAVFTTVLVIFMHRSNIKRLINGTESRFNFKK